MLARERDRADGMFDPGVVHSWIDMAKSRRVVWFVGDIEPEEVLTRNPCSMAAFGTYQTLRDVRVESALRGRSGHS